MEASVSSKTMMRKTSDEANAEKCLLCYGPHTVSKEEKGFSFELKNFKDIFTKSFGIQFLSHFSDYGKVSMCQNCHELFLKVEAVYDEFVDVERRFDALREKFAFIVVESIINSEYISNYAHTNAFDAIRYLVFKVWGEKFRKSRTQSRPQQQQQQNGCTKSVVAAEESSLLKNEVQKPIQKKLDTIIHTSSVTTTNTSKKSTVDGHTTNKMLNQRVGNSKIDNKEIEEKSTASTTTNVIVTHKTQEVTTAKLPVASSDSVASKKQQQQQPPPQSQSKDKVIMQRSADKTANTTTPNDTAPKAAPSTVVETVTTAKTVKTSLPPEKPNLNDKPTPTTTTTTKSMPQSEFVIQSIVSKAPTNPTTSSTDSDKLIKVVNIKKEVPGPSQAPTPTAATTTKPSSFRLSADGNKITPTPNQGGAQTKQRVIFVKRDPVTGKMIQIHNVPPDCSLTGLDQKSLNILKQSGALKSMQASNTLTKGSVSVDNTVGSKTTISAAPTTSTTTTTTSSVVTPSTSPPSTSSSSNIDNSEGSKTVITRTMATAQRGTNPSGTRTIQTHRKSMPQRPTVPSGLDGVKKAVTNVKPVATGKTGTETESEAVNNGGVGIRRSTKIDATKVTKEKIDNQNKQQDGDVPNDDEGEDEGKQAEEAKEQESTVNEPETAGSGANESNKGRDSQSISPESRAGRRRTVKRVYDPNSWASGEEMDKLVSKYGKSDKKDKKEKSSPSKRAKRASDHVGSEDEDETS